MNIMKTIDKKFLVIGDIHGSFSSMNTIINKKHPDVLIQAGDNAYFWDNKCIKGIIKNNNTKVYMIPGNHEDWNMFEREIGRLGNDPIEVEPNVFYCPIGSTITINDKIIMFIGGAESIDKAARIIGIDWFKEELLTQKDIDFILNRNVKPDIIISHTCPVEFDISELGRDDKIGDPTRYVLSILLEQFTPELWIFAHWHAFINGKYRNTRWICLNKVYDTGWWKWLLL